MDGARDGADLAHICSTQIVLERAIDVIAVAEAVAPSLYLS
jgi:hypothetical protein